MRSLLLGLALALLGVLIAAPSAQAAWTWPLSGEVITPYRNGDDPYAAGQHRGLDIAGAVGTPVVAAAAGEVLFAGTAGSSGVTVSVRTGEGLDTSYLHLSAVAVSKGETVAAGRRIGAVGTSGRRTVERPHLHFGVRRSGSRHLYLDPLALLPPVPVAVPRDPLPTPAPLGAPERVVPEPAPVPLASPQVSPEPGRAPVRRRVPAARRVPVGRRVPAHGGARAALPVQSPSPVATEAPAPDRRPTAAPGPGPQPVRDAGGKGRRAAPSAQLEAGPQPTPAQATVADTPRRQPGGSAAPPAGERFSGPDLGLALACLGLLLAAAILGLTGEGRDRARRGAGKLSTLLRPLAGRG